MAKTTHKAAKGWGKNKKAEARLHGTNKADRRAAIADQRNG